jgi:hypothetical protein
VRQSSNLRHPANPLFLQTSFDVGKAQRIKSLMGSSDRSASDMLRDSKGRRVFAKTRNLQEKGPACRVSFAFPAISTCCSPLPPQIYGSMDVKKVTGNLHIVSLPSSSHSSKS